MPGVIMISGQRTYVSGGGSVPADGATFNMAGSGFGTNVSSALQMWVGGIGGPIESNVAGTILKTSSTGSGLLGTGWTCNTGYSETQQFVSDIQAFSGTKSIMERYGYSVYSGGTYDAGSNFQYGIAYDFGAGYQAIYSNCRFYLDNNGQTSGQIKFHRWVGATNGGYQDNDYPNILLNQVGFAAFNTTANGGSISDTDSITGPIWVFGGWVQFEIFFRPGSSGVANGSIQYRITRCSDGTVLSSGTVSSHLAWGGADNPYRFLLLHGYIGNGMESNGTRLYFDRDIYAVANTASNAFPKYVALGDASTYAACTKRLLSVQKFNSWSDTVIQIVVNRGAHASLNNKYLYAMNGIDSAINSSGVPLVT